MNRLTVEDLLQALGATALIVIGLLLAADAIVALMNVCGASASVEGDSA